MKKIILLIATIIVTFSLTGCVNKGLTEVNYGKVEEMFRNKEDFVLYIGSTNCSHCQSYKPKLESVIRSNSLTVYYLDISKITEEQYNSLSKLVTFSGTPHTVFIENGSIKEVGEEGNTYSIEGDRDIDYIKLIFKKNGYIK